MAISSLVRSRCHSYSATRDHGSSLDGQAEPSGFAMATAGSSGKARAWPERSSNIAENRTGEWPRSSGAAAGLRRIPKAMVPRIPVEHAVSTCSPSNARSSEETFKSFELVGTVCCQRPDRRHGTSEGEGNIRKMYFRQFEQSVIEDHRRAGLLSQAKKWVHC